MACAARRTKRVAKNRAIPPAAWTEGRFNAWVDAQDLVAHAVTLYHPRPGCQALAQRLDGWKGVLGLYRYTIRHIPGDRNAWGDLLLYWVSVPPLLARVVAVFSPCDHSMPSKAVVRCNGWHIL